MASDSYEGPSARDVLQPLVTSCIVLITLQTIFVILRLVARLLVKRAEIGWDDYLIIPAFITNIGGAVAALGTSVMFANTLLTGASRFATCKAV